MSKLKKIIGNILVIMITVLSLGMLSGCKVVDQSVAKIFDQDITVYRDGLNAYIYNGERYVRTSEMDNYIPNCSYNHTSAATFIGYGYSVIGIKDPVYVNKSDQDCNVIIFCGYFNNLFYVKETIQLPPPLEIECVLRDDFETTFRLKDLVSEKKDFDGLKKTKNLELIGFRAFYFWHCRSLSMYFHVYMDEKKNIYINGDRNNLGCYEIIDEEFKQRLIVLCAD